MTDPAKKTGKDSKISENNSSKNVPAKQNDQEKSKTNDSKAALLVDLGFLEEDDDFDEFPAENYDSMEHDEDIIPVNIWANDWDDDNIEDDFSSQLKTEFEKRTLNLAGSRK